MITYYETNNVDINEVLNSWIMTMDEKRKYVNKFRNGPHKYMPTIESLIEQEEYDQQELSKLLMLNNTFSIIKKDEKIISLATIINYQNEKVLVYLLPSRYQFARMIDGALNEIKNNNNASSIRKFSDLAKNIKYTNIPIPKREYNPIEIELNNIKTSINVLLNNGISKETIVSEILDYLNQKTYHK